MEKRGGISENTSRIEKHDHKPLSDHLRREQMLRTEPAVLQKRLPLVHDNARNDGQDSKYGNFEITRS